MASMDRTHSQTIELDKQKLLKVPVTETTKSFSVCMNQVLMKDRVYLYMTPPTDLVIKAEARYYEFIHVLLISENV